MGNHHSLDCPNSNSNCFEVNSKMAVSLFRNIFGFTYALDILSDFLMFLLPILVVWDLWVCLSVSPELI
jgi:hypothetical protein